MTCSVLLPNSKNVIYELLLATVDIHKHTSIYYNISKAKTKINSIYRLVVSNTSQQTQKMHFLFFKLSTFYIYYKLIAFHGFICARSISDKLLKLIWKTLINQAHWINSAPSYLCYCATLI